MNIKVRIEDMYVLIADHVLSRTLKCFTRIQQFDNYIRKRQLSNYAFAMQMHFIHLQSIDLHSTYLHMARYLKQQHMYSKQTIWRPIVTRNC